MFGYDGFFRFPISLENPDVETKLLGGASRCSEGVRSICVFVPVHEASSMPSIIPPIPFVDRDRWSVDI